MSYGATTFRDRSPMMVAILLTRARCDGIAIETPMTLNGWLGSGSGTKA